MLIVCPTCATSYDVELASLRPIGRLVRCSRCRTIWHAESSHSDMLIAAAAALAPARVAEPAVENAGAATAAEPAVEALTEEAGELRRPIAAMHDPEVEETRLRAKRSTRRPSSMKTHPRPKRRCPMTD